MAQDNSMNLSDVAGGIAAGTGVAATGTLISGLRLSGLTADEVERRLARLAERSVDAGKQAAGQFLQHHHADSVAQVVDYANKTPEVEGLLQEATRLGQQVADAQKLRDAAVYKKPLIAFESMTTSGKIGLGAVVMGSALGAAYLLNQWRARGESHVERLQRERSVAERSR